LFVVIEDHRSMLRPLFLKLPIDLGWVDVVPKDLQQGRVRDAGRVELHLYHFRVSGLSSGDLLVCGISGRPAHEARGGRKDACHALENGLHAQEAASGERRRARGGHGRRRRGREEVPRGHRGSARTLHDGRKRSGQRRAWQRCDDRHKQRNGACLAQESAPALGCATGRIAGTVLQKVRRFQLAQRNAHQILVDRPRDACLECGGDIRDALLPVACLPYQRCGRIETMSLAGVLVVNDELVIDVLHEKPLPPGFRHYRRLASGDHGCSLIQDSASHLAC